jgi:uncharacterized Zn-finger protein
MTETKRCSMCHCVKLLSLFKIRQNTGVLLKTCIKCSERFKCDRDGCNYTSSRKGDLQKHIKAVHDQIRDFKCDSECCNYTCSENETLQAHIKAVHDNIKNFKCDREGCDFRCSTNSNLQVHIKAVHYNIKNFKCDRDGCYSTFSRNADLQQHIEALHDKIKNFKCDRDGCDFRCSTNGTLQAHIKAIHNQIKDFECDIEGCNFKSSSNSSLQVHIKTCTGSSNISSGEFKMIKSFEELGFFEDKDYRHNSTFSELTTSCGKRLRFDFMFINHKKVFEFDGRQHFMPVRFGNMTQEEAEENFRKQQEYDKIKDDFCKNKGFKMVRISYTDYPNILSILHCELMDIMDNIG